MTPRPQPGNPRPRLFRLDEDRAVINRFGFNSKGLAALSPVCSRLQRGAARGMSVRMSEKTATRSMRPAITRRHRGGCGLADYLVCNVSSPNTPGLRNLQARDQMEELIARVWEARTRRRCVRAQTAAAGEGRARSAHDEVRDIGEVALARKIDGLISAIRQSIVRKICAAATPGKRVDCQAGHCCVRQMHV